MLADERPRQWEHEQDCQNADEYLFRFHDAYRLLSSILVQKRRCGKGTMPNGEFRCGQFACYLDPLSTAAAHLEKAIKLPWRVSSPKDSSSAM